MPFLTDRQRETLRMVCDTLVPKLLARPGEDEALFAFCAHDLHVPEQLEATVEQIADENGRRRLQSALGYLDSRLANGFMAGLWDKFCELSLDERTKVLLSWSTSRMESPRRSFQVMKRLALFAAYAGRNADGENPAWPAIGYNGKCDTTSAHATFHQSIKPLVIHKSTTLDADVLIVGSGAGGGVVADELSAAGLDVLVAEKGDYFADADFPGNELDGMHKLYERQGLLSTADLSFVVLAGSTVGGGTTVNWMTSLRPPQSVLDEWASEFGFTAAKSGELQQSIDAVCRRMNVNTDESPANAQNSALERGCQQLGYRTSVIPRNVKSCQQCDFCGFGCPFGAKQDTRNTYLLDAHQRGARILPRATVNRILHSGGEATGAELSVHDDEGRTHDVQVKCKTVVVAAGSIHTPAIHLRSGLRNRHIGQNLHLHPTTAVFARYPTPVNSWAGPPQTRVCDEFSNLDESGYGVRMEVCPAHPGLWASALPWRSGREHKHHIQQLDHLANIIILTRDRYGGRVTITPSGRPVMNYNLHSYDAAHMMRGTIEALRIQHAAGAQEIFSPHMEGLSFKRDGDENFESYLQRVQAKGIKAHLFGLFSAHQLSSCRIAGDKSQGAVNPEGQCYELRNLYVADGSVLPNACGVNPMITIMGLAHHIAQHVKNAHA